ncbi:MAG: glycoside hydrolase domain-containing protein, partial [Ferruginibacter sp.]
MISVGVIYFTVTQTLSVHLENGNTFSVTAIDQSDKNVYVKKVLLNGQLLDRCYITHDEIMKGGKLEFFMSA